jgi:hypothetical protein
MNRRANLFIPTGKETAVVSVEMTNMLLQGHYDLDIGPSPYTVSDLRSVEREWLTFPAPPLIPRY